MKLEKGESTAEALMSSKKRQRGAVPFTPLPTLFPAPFSNLPTL